MPDKEKEFREALERLLDEHNVHVEESASYDNEEHYVGSDFYFVGEGFMLNVYHLI